jgi:hypothetical protein
MVKNSSGHTKNNLDPDEFKSAQKKRIISSIVIAIMSGALLTIAFVFSNTETKIVAPGDPNQQSNQNL